jgi:hypothetical protein
VQRSKNKNKPLEKVFLRLTFSVITVFCNALISQLLRCSVLFELPFLIWLNNIIRFMHRIETVHRQQPLLDLSDFR